MRPNFNEKDKGNLAAKVVATVAGGDVARLLPLVAISTIGPLLWWDHGLEAECISILERCAMEEPRGNPKSFEETYPRYPFAGLVRLGIGLARLYVRLRRSAQGRRVRRTSVGRWRAP